MVMDAHLKLLADIGLALNEAEDAAGAGEVTQASEALDGADADLATLRERWAGMSAAERAVVGPAASQLRARLDDTRKRLPKRTALSEGAPEVDPDQDRDPEAGGAPAASTEAATG
jgi:hypothetical protein